MTFHFVFECMVFYACKYHRMQSTNESKLHVGILFILFLSSFCLKNSWMLIEKSYARIILSLDFFQLFHSTLHWIVIFFQWKSMIAWHCFVSACKKNIYVNREGIVCTFSIEKINPVYCFMLFCACACASCRCYSIAWLLIACILIISMWKPVHVVLLFVLLSPYKKSRNVFFEFRTFDLISLIFQLWRFVLKLHPLHLYWFWLFDSNRLHFSRFSSIFSTIAMHDRYIEIKEVAECIQIWIILWFYDH